MRLGQQANLIELNVNEVRRLAQMPGQTFLHA